MIICYERLNQKNKGLTNGFRDLMGLFQFVKSDVPAISHLTGKVDALSANDKAGLTNQQLHRFYRDILQAPLAPDLGLIGIVGPSLRSRHCESTIFESTIGQ